MSHSAFDNVPESISIEAVWEMNPRLVPTVANQLHLSTAAGEQATGVQLVFGYANPPFLQGRPTPETIAEFGVVPIVPVGSYYMPLDVARGLMESLNNLFTELDKTGTSDD